MNETYLYLHMSNWLVKITVLSLKRISKNSLSSAHIRMNSSHSLRILLSCTVCEVEIFENMNGNVKFDKNQIVPGYCSSS